MIRNILAPLAPRIMGPINFFKTISSVSCANIKSSTKDRSKSRNTVAIISKIQNMDSRYSLIKQLDMAISMESIRILNTKKVSDNGSKKIGNNRMRMQLPNKAHRVTDESIIIKMVFSNSCCQNDYCFSVSQFSNCLNWSTTSVCFF